MQGKEFDTYKVGTAVYQSLIEDNARHGSLSKARFKLQYQSLIEVNARF